MKYINDFLNFKVNESAKEGFAQLKEDEALEVIDKNCQDNFGMMQDFGPFVFRGMDSKADYLFFNPKNMNRKSANTENYYTLLVDNSKQWSKFPKRSKSIICTLDKNTAENYGTCYTVIPFDKNSNFGICQHRDFWYSFQKTVGESLNNLNTVIKNTLKDNNCNIQDSDFKILKKELSSIKKVNFGDDVKDYTEKLYDLYLKNKYTDAYDLFDTCLDPVANNFRYGDFKLVQKVAAVVNRFEVWTDTPSILIKSSLL